MPSKTNFITSKITEQIGKKEGVLSLREIMLIEDAVELREKEILDIIDKCSGIKCGWMDGEICDRIDKEELKQALKGNKNG